MTKFYAFRDTTTGKTFATEDDMWAHLCDKYGIGYVFENIEEISA